MIIGGYLVESFSIKPNLCFDGFSTPLPLLVSTDSIATPLPLLVSTDGIFFAVLLTFVYALGVVMWDVAKYFN